MTIETPIGERFLLLEKPNCQSFKAESMVLHRSGKNHRKRGSRKLLPRFFMRYRLPRDELVSWMPGEPRKPDKSGFFDLIACVGISPTEVQS